MRTVPENVHTARCVQNTSENGAQYWPDQRRYECRKNIREETQSDKTRIGMSILFQEVHQLDSIGKTCQSPW